MIFDDRDLLRNAVQCFLTDWALERKLRIVSADICDPPAASDQLECMMFVVNVGRTFDNPQHHKLVRALSTIAWRPPVVVLSDSQAMTDIVGALQCGARAFIPTSTPPGISLSILSFVLDGGSYFPPEALLRPLDPWDDPQEQKRIERLVEPPKGPESSAGPNAVEKPAPSAEAVRDRLTDRQSHVLGYLRQGQSNKEIARTLNVSESTVKVHVRQIIKKLGVTNRTQAALVAHKERPASAAVLPRHPNGGTRTLEHATSLSTSLQ